MDRKDTTAVSTWHSRCYRVYPMSLVFQRVVCRDGTEGRGEQRSRSVTEIQAGADKKARRDFLSRARSYGCGLLVILSIHSIGRAQDITVGDGIPDRTGAFEEEVMLHSWNDETFDAEEVRCAPPKIRRDFGQVGALFQSPVDAMRQVEAIPNFCLAKWHWWLLKDDVLARALRQYAKCVSRVSLLQELQGFVGIDDPKHPSFFEVKNVEEYLPTFEVVQPFGYEKHLDYGVRVAGIRHYKEHIKAVIESIAITTANTALCKETERQLLTLFKGQWQRIPSPPSRRRR